MKHIVYKYVLKGEIIYIGKSDKGVRRALAHGRAGDNIEESGWDEINRSDVYIAEMANGSMTEIYESELIRRYKPKYNKGKTNDWAGVSLPEPTWILLRQYGIDKKDLEWKQRYDEISNNYKVLLMENEKLKEQYEKMTNKCTEAMMKADERLEMHYYIPDYSRICEAVREATSHIKGSGIEWKDIIEKYRDSSRKSKLCYISLAYDNNGELNCRKIIYTDNYDFLQFHFEQLETTTQSGCLLSRRNEEHITNWLTFRQWINRGSNKYYEIEMPKTEIKQYGNRSNYLR